MSSLASFQILSLELRTVNSLSAISFQMVSKPHEACPSQDTILSVRNGKINSRSLIPKSDKYFISIAKISCIGGRRKRQGRNCVYFCHSCVSCLFITGSILLFFTINLRMLLGMQQRLQNKRDGSESLTRHFLSEFLLAYLGLFLNNLVTH